MNNKVDVPRTFQIKTYRPTWEEFKDMKTFIINMEKDGAHLAGIAKIVPPKEWIVCKSNYKKKIINAMKITPQPQRVRVATKGFHQFVTQIPKPAMSVERFKEQCEKDHPIPSDGVDLPSAFWSDVVTGRKKAVLYGEGVAGSLMDKELVVWNFQKLGTILDLVEDEQGKVYNGVNTPWLYFGSWKAAFGWHTEDMDLYSINYLHFGKPKHWYVIPPSHSYAFERLCRRLFPEQFDICPAFLRHKVLLAHPEILSQHNIPIDEVIQGEGDLIVTFPYGYHSGFNYGFNCAEAINFAYERWVEYGKRASLCICRGISFSVRIDMELFVKRFQCEKLQKWLKNEDIGPHPEGPAEKTFACGKDVRIIGYSQSPHDDDYIVNVVYEETRPHHSIIKQDESQYFLNELETISDDGLEPISDDELEETFDNNYAYNQHVSEEKSVKVTNLPYETKTEDLEIHFRDCGPILRVSIPLDIRWRKPRGFGVIEFMDKSCVDKAVMLDGKPIGQFGRRLNVTRIRVKL